MHNRDSLIHDGWTVEFEYMNTYERKNQTKTYLRKKDHQGVLNRTHVDNAGAVRAPKRPHQHICECQPGRKPG